MLRLGQRQSLRFHYSGSGYKADKRIVGRMLSANKGKRMKTSKQIGAMVVMMVLLGLACGGGSFTPPAVTIPAGMAETAQALSGTAAAAAGTAAVQAGTVAVQAGTVAAQGGAAVQTVVAAGTPDINALREKLAALLPDENGNVTVTITDDDVNQAIQSQPAEGQLQNPAVTFTGGNVVLVGDVTEPVTARLTVVFRPYVADGLLQFEVVQATLGNVNVPPTLLQSAENTLNGTLGDALNNLPAGIEVTGITMGEGTMVVVGRREA